MGIGALFKSNTVSSSNKAPPTNGPAKFGEVKQVSGERGQQATLDPSGQTLTLKGSSSYNDHYGAGEPSLTVTLRTPGGKETTVPVRTWGDSSAEGAASALSKALPPGFEASVKTLGEKNKYNDGRNDLVEVRINYKQPSRGELQSQISKLQGQLHKLEGNQKKLGWQADKSQGNYADNVNNGGWGAKATRKRDDSLQGLRNANEKVAGNRDEMASVQKQIDRLVAALPDARP